MRIPCNCGAVTVGGKSMPHYHGESAIPPQLGSK